MTDVSRPETMVDASAYVASLVTGVKTVWGLGTAERFGPSSDVAIRAFPGEPAEPYTHVSDLPDAPAIAWKSASVTELTWQIPMALYIDVNDLAQARRILAPFYGGYLAVFAKHIQLEGRANSSQLTSFRVTQEAATWCALRMTLTCIERLNLANTP